MSQRRLAGLGPRCRTSRLRAGLGPGMCRDPSLEASPETIPVFCGAMPPTPESSSQVCRVLVTVFTELCVCGLCVQISQSAGDANTSTETGSAGGGKVVYLQRGRGLGRAIQEEQKEKQSKYQRYRCMYSCFLNFAWTCFSIFGSSHMCKPCTFPVSASDLCIEG